MFEHPVALQPPVVDVVEIVPCGLDGGRHVHQVEVGPTRCVKDPEAALLIERHQKGGTTGSAPAGATTVRILKSR